jgi:hypothetical protein
LSGSGGAAAKTGQNERETRRGVDEIVMKFL